MLSASLLLALVLVASANVPECNGPMVFSPQQQVSDVWYPLNYTNTLPPVFPDSFDCTYQIKVPEGYYALIYLYVNYTNYQNGSTTPVKVIDQSAKIEEIDYNSHQRFWFIANGGRIKLSSGTSKVRFGFQLNWWPFPAMNPNMTQVSAFNPRATVLKTNVNETIQVQADTQVSATILYPDANYLQWFRSILFFDGPSTSMFSYIGNGLQLLNGNTQYVSTAKIMTIMFLSKYTVEGFTNVILQDYGNTKQIAQFQGLRLAPTADGIFTMNATNGLVAVQTYSSQQYSDNPNVLMSLEGTGVLDVFLGGVTKNKSNLITSYYAENCQDYLPQLFPGYLKTYVLKSGHAILKIGAKLDKNYQAINSFGKKGVLVSSDYKMMSSSQDVFFRIDPPVDLDRPVLKYTIDYADLAPGATLQIESVDADSKFVDVNFNNSHLPSLGMMSEISGNRFYVTYKSNGHPNQGMYMNFELVESSSNSAGYVLIISIFLCFMMN